MNEAPVLVAQDGAVATVTLNRPEKHNAFDDAVIARLTEAFARLAGDRTVRVVVLAARGKSFCAGADLGHMRRTADFSPEENLADARALPRLFGTLHRLPQPTLALVQGPAYAGGMGLIAACDIAIAVETARFALTEVRLSLVPAAISPYVIEAMGPAEARRYILTGERFDARTAARIGLVHETVADGPALEERGARVIEMLLQGSPDALRRAKELIAAVAGRPIDQALAEETARRIADARASEDGREGTAAFLEKRKPRWQAE